MRTILCARRADKSASLTLPTLLLGVELLAKARASETIRQIFMGFSNFFGVTMMKRRCIATVALAITAAITQSLAAGTDEYGERRAVSGDWADSTKWSAGQPTSCVGRRHWCVRFTLHSFHRLAGVRPFHHDYKLPNATLLLQPRGSLNSNISLDVIGGTIALNHGTFSINGITVNNAVIQTSGSGTLLFPGSSVLNNVTLGASFTLPTHVGMSVLNNLTLNNAVIHMQSDTSGGLGSSIIFASGTSQNLAGTGTIYFDSGSYNTIGDSQLTIASGITISSGTSGGTLTFAQNAGTIAALTSQITINGANWTNTGIIQIVPSRNVSGRRKYNYCRSGNRLSCNGGNLTFAGVLNNTNASLDAGALGSFSLNGTIKGGTISSSNNATVTLYNGSTLRWRYFGNLPCSCRLRPNHD